MEEIWKDIAGYEGLYQVSNFGRVKSYRQSSKYGKKDEFILRGSLSNNGYLDVTLCKGPNERHKFLLHRLVASAFVDNPNGYTCVNHKDEDRLNNHADNLEWCTIAYNNAYGTAKIRQAITTGKKIEQYTITGIHLATYNSLSIAVMITGVSKHTIVDCCSGHYKTGAGYVWKYAES